MKFGMQFEPVDLIMSYQFYCAWLKSKRDNFTQVVCANKNNQQKKKVK